MPETESTPSRKASGGRDGKSAAGPDGQIRSLVPYQPNTALEDRRGKGLILIVDEDTAYAEDTADALQHLGYVIHIANHGEAALEFLKQINYDLVLTELEMKSVGGLDILRRGLESSPFLAVVIFTARPSVDSAVEAMRLGAVDYMAKTGDVEDVLESLHKRIRRAIELQRLQKSQRRQLQPATIPHSPFASIIHVSEKMSEVIVKCDTVARTDASVLITGESGTGKELLARAIHETSPRTGHFVPINCAALSPQIIESELFGHEKGSFTGATAQRKGFFEYANRGTIFLDEVGDIPLETQVKLLRVLENREISRVGSNVPIPVDVRVISATHRQLEDLVKEGKFREDLYYRLKVVPIHVPPLRHRTQDIPPLVNFFLGQYSEAYGKSFSGIQGEALAALLKHPWKGNVRELKHAVENLVVIAPGPEITIHDLPESIRQSHFEESDPSGSAVENLVGQPIKDVERELIRHTLLRVNGNRQEAARILGIGERTLYRKLQRYALS